MIWVCGRYFPMFIVSSCYAYSHDQADIYFRLRGIDTKGLSFWTMSELEYKNSIAVWEFKMSDRFTEHDVHAAKIA